MKIEITSIVRGQRKEQQVV